MGIATRIFGMIHYAIVIADHQGIKRTGNEIIQAIQALCLISGGMVNARIRNMEVQSILTGEKSALMIGALMRINTFTDFTREEVHYLSLRQSL